MCTHAKERATHITRAILIAPASCRTLRLAVTDLKKSTLPPENVQLTQKVCNRCIKKRAAMLKCRSRLSSFVLSERSLRRPRRDWI